MPKQPSRRNDVCRSRLTRLLLGVALLPLAADIAGAQTPDPQPTSRPVQNAYLNLNVAMQDGNRALIGSMTMPLYDETAAFDVLHASSGGLTFDGSIGVRLWQNFALGLGVTRFRAPSSVDVRGSVPHPLFFGRPRLVELQPAGFDHGQVGVHLQLVWLLQLSDRIDVALSAGPSLFLVTQDRVSEVALGEAGAPYTDVLATPVKETARTEAFGGNVGLDLTYRLARHLGAGFFVRWTEARAKLPEFGPDTTVEAGGLQSGLGLRLRF